MKGNVKMNKAKNADRVKNSIVLSGIVGTLGLFIAKMLGLFYSIPLSSILGSDAYMSYYGTSFRIYSYILNVFTAGFPFAIATMVAKYSVRQDARALRKIKKVELVLLGMTGFLGMLLLFVLSWPLSHIIASGSDAPIMGRCLRILSLAIFFVPILSGFRGFYQGRKEMSQYAVSQVFEQIFRVGFLLTAAYIIVYVLHMDRRYALYVAVMSTSIAAVAGILQFAYFDRHHFPAIEEAARSQTTKTVRKKKLFQELVALAIPYLLVAVLGYCDDIFNSVLLPVGLKVHGYTSSQQSIILSAFNYVGTKMTAIPMILSPGFAAALIPHITAARTQGNKKLVCRNVVDCLNIIVYLGIPVSFCIFLYARDVFHILFYTSDEVTAANCLRWLALEGFLATITPVITNILMALGMKHEALKNLGVNLIIKGASMVPLIWMFGYAGAVLSTVPGNLYIVFASFKAMHQEHEISFRSVGSIFLKSIACIVLMFAVSTVLAKVGITGAYGRKVIALGKTCINVLITLGVYFGVSAALKMPEQVFHRRLSAVVKARLQKKNV